MRSLILLGSALAAAAPLAAQAPLSAQALVPAPSQTAQGDIAVTIYNNNRALIEDKRQLDLPGDTGPLPLTVLFWPAAEFDQVLRRWPGFAETCGTDHVQHMARMAPQRRNRRTAAGFIPPPRRSRESIDPR